MSTAHLLRFGSRELERQEFQEILEQFIQNISAQQKWRLQ
jgi:Leu/Phe-tRNA-protein transferase